MTVAVIVHVFYADMWPDLADCIRQVRPQQLIISYVDEQAVEQARLDFPSAHFMRCENRGYDVWPFLCALKQLKLGETDLIVKLHTKRNIERVHPLIMGGTRLNDGAWRNLLLSFVRTPAAWQRTLACFEDPRVGMVASKAIVYGRRESGRALFDAARRDVRERYGLRVPRQALFVGGTMFAVRARLLQPLVDQAPQQREFACDGSHANNYAHVMERVFGFLVQAQGMRLAAFDGSVRLRRFGLALRRFFYENRWSERRHSIRILGITVYLRRFDETRS